jgi:hypothetical protein
MMLVAASDAQRDGNHAGIRAVIDTFHRRDFIAVGCDLVLLAVVTKYAISSPFIVQEHP